MRNSKYLDLKEQRIAHRLSGGRAVGAAPRYLSAAIRSNLPAASVTAARDARDGGSQSADQHRVFRCWHDDIDRTCCASGCWRGCREGSELLAAVLTLVGLYGLIAYTVTRRTNEIGVRMALGAGPRRDRAADSARDGFALGVGAAIGAAMAAGAGRSAATLLFGLRPWDPVSMAVALCALAAIAFAASYAPMRRAVRIEPVIALRQE